MEFPVESPCDGIVLEILPDEGESVNEEQIVAILDDNT